MTWSGIAVINPSVLGNYCPFFDHSCVYSLFISSLFILYQCVPCSSLDSYASNFCWWNCFSSYSSLLCVYVARLSGIYCWLAISMVWWSDVCLLWKYFLSDLICFVCNAYTSIGHLPPRSRAIMILSLFGCSFLYFVKYLLVVMLTFSRSVLDYFMMPNEYVRIRMACIFIALNKFFEFTFVFKNGCSLSVCCFFRCCFIYVWLIRVFCWKLRYLYISFCSMSFNISLLSVADSFSLVQRLFFYM